MTHMAYIYILPYQMDCAWRSKAAATNNHAEITELWDWSLTVSQMQTEMKARIRFVKIVMTTFDFYFGCTL